VLDPREFKAPFIPIEKIRKAADEFRSQYWSQDTIPVDIFEILEFELGIEIRPVFNLKEAGDVDALLLGDLITIAIDQNDFLNERAQNRLRFSVAHKTEKGTGTFIGHGSHYTRDNGYRE